MTGAITNSNNSYLATTGNNTCTLESSSSLVNNHHTTTAVVHVQDDKSYDDHENENELDFVGAGTLGDIMSGFGGRRSSISGSIMDDDVIFKKQSTIIRNGAAAAATTTINTPAAVIDGLVTKEGGELNSRYKCNFTPMERIALTANGNLQRIFSSYYDAPVHVHVDSCVRRRRRRRPETEQRERNSYSNSLSKLLEEEEEEDVAMTFNKINNDAATLFENSDKNDSNARDKEENEDIAIWDRVVHLTIHNNHTVLCKATSIIWVTSPTCIQLIESGSVGLGQMFRYLNKLPTFSLLDAGKRGEIMSSNDKNKLLEDDGVGKEGMWRTYKLQCEEMTCLIHEEFHRDAWDLL